MPSKIIGLYNLEPKIVNTALMQVSTYYKNLGFKVEKYNPLFKDKYYKVYAFSIFKFTSKAYVTKEMIKGGSGFDILTKLPQEIENCNYDYTFYPKCDYSIIWFSRGCIRKCPFCIVFLKEGYIHSVEPKNLNPNGKYIKIQDNNFFSNPNWKESIKLIKNWNQPVEFSSGIDIRLINKEQCDILNNLKIKRQIKFAWDNTKEDIIPHIKEILKYIKPYKLMCYVLIGFNSTKEEDLYRINILKSFKIDPYVMPYNKKDIYQKDFSRWVNMKAIYKTVKWEDYKKCRLKRYQ